jgi:flagellar protein FliO/FliZ
MQNLAEKLGLGEGMTSTLLWIGLSIVLLVVVLALAVWLVRTLRPSLNLGGSHARAGRPQRLAITDAFSMDREGRKLVIVRRDNTEHLLLIGGPNDLLVEANIVRNERAARERGRPMNDADLLHAAEAALATDLPRQDAAVHEAQGVAPPAPLAPGAPAPRAMPSSSNLRPQMPPPLDDEFENALAAMQAAQRQKAGPRPAPPPVAAPPMGSMAPAPVAPAPPQSMPMPAPPFLAPEPVPQPRFQPMPEMPPMAAPRPPMPQPEPPVASTPPAQRPQPVSEMARRLNEVLQKPMSGTLRPPFNKAIPPAPPMSASPAAGFPPADPAKPAAALIPPVSPAPAHAEPAVPPPAAAAKAPVKAADLEMDLLEEEMARLLGRPQTPGSNS